MKVGADRRCASALAPVASHTGQDRAERERYEKRLHMHGWLRLEVALTRWENEGGACAQAMQSEHALQAGIPQSMNTELEHLRVRMIAMENLLITVLAQAPDQQLELGREMAAFISPRPGFTQHPTTVGAATQMAHLLQRARHFQGWVEGDTLA